MPSRAGTLGLRMALAAGILAGLIPAASAAAALPQQAGTVDLAGQFNLRIDGAQAGDGTGGSVAGAGDVNGDGIGDFILGAPTASPNGIMHAGAAYVIFGGPQQGTLDLSNLGSRGFVIDGVDVANSAGTSVAGAGDVNGDGLADVIVGAPGFNGNVGAAFVIFGKKTTGAVDIGALGAGGFRIDGQQTDDHTGESVTGVGDMNGDGLADVAVGAPPNPVTTNRVGKAFVVFGKGSTSAVDLNALGNGGFEIDGPQLRDMLGETIAGPGDVNGDGVPDVAIGAPQYSPTATDQGGAFVVFGKGSSTPVDLSAAFSGFSIQGAAAGDFAGDGLAAAGDLNGGGQDLLVGAPNASFSGRSDSGEAYAVFGKASTTTVDLASLGMQGFPIGGAAADDEAGLGLAGVGDVNGDGRPDIAVGADGEGNNGRPSSGSTYVVFGQALPPAAADLANPASTGIRIDGASANDFSGSALAGPGDLNGDGRPDVLLGVGSADNNGRADSGSAYVVYGFGVPSLSYPQGLTGSTGHAVSPLAPAVRRTGPATFTATPPLPAGLTIAADTGVISGTPTAGEKSTTHTITMQDLAGTASATVTVRIADVTPPAIAGFSMTRRVFAVGRARTPVSARRKTGSAFVYRLSENARASIQIARRLPGRRAGLKCRKPSARLRKNRPCTRFRTVGSLKRRARAGSNKNPFSGRIGRRALRVGRYRATITATDPSGNRSRPRRVSFRIVKR